MKNHESFKKSFFELPWRDQAVVRIYSILFVLSGTEQARDLFLGEPLRSWAPPIGAILFLAFAALPKLMPDFMFRLLKLFPWSIIVLESIFILKDWTDYDYLRLCLSIFQIFISAGVISSTRKLPDYFKKLKVE